MVSIIVPYYNGSRYIDECISSILNQTYKDIEVLLIDDGSDPTERDYIEKFTDTCKVFHQKRGGVSAARNFGIDNSHGDYICFVDADDIIHPQFVESLYKSILKNNVEIAACKMKRFSDGVEFSELTNASILIAEAEKYKNILQNNNSAEGFLWNKIYARRIIADIRFDTNLIMCEDQLFVFQAVDKVINISVVCDELYYYRINPHSATMSSERKIKKAQDRLLVSRRLLDYVQGDEETIVGYRQMIADATVQYCMRIAEGTINREIYKSLGLCADDYRKNDAHSKYVGGKLLHRKRLILFVIYAKCRYLTIGTIKLLRKLSK